MGCSCFGGASWCRNSCESIGSVAARSVVSRAVSACVSVRQRQHGAFLVMRSQGWDENSLTGQVQIPRLKMIGIRI